MNMVAGNAVRSIYHAASKEFIADVSEYLFCPPFVSLYERIPSCAKAK
jgi:hypothetical protein